MKKRTIKSQSTDYSRQEDAGSAISLHTKLVEVRQETGLVIAQPMLMELVVKRLAYIGDACAFPFKLDITFLRGLEAG